MAALDTFLFIFCALVYFTNMWVDRREAVYRVAACYLKEVEEDTTTRDLLNSCGVHNAICFTYTL